MVHNACQSLLHDEETQGEEEFRGHLRRLTRENNVPRKRQVCAYRFTTVNDGAKTVTPLAVY